MCANEIIEQAIDRHGNTVLRLAYSYMKNKYDAEDVFQDVFMKLYQNLDKMKDEEHMKAWLIRVTSNISKNKLKSFSHSKSCHYEEYVKETHRHEKEDNLVMNAVFQLPEKYRGVIHLYYYEGYSTKEIAKTLGRRDTTVRSQLARGRKLLKSTLKGEYDFVHSI